MPSNVDRSTIDVVQPEHVGRPAEGAQASTAPGSPAPSRAAVGKVFAVVAGSFLIALLVLFGDSDIVRFGNDRGALDDTRTVVEHDASVGVAHSGVEDQTGPIDNRVYFSDRSESIRAFGGGGLVQDAEAQSTQTNICDRTWQVARAIAQTMIDLHPTYRPTNPLPTETSCSDIWRELPTRRLSEISFTREDDALGRTRYDHPLCSGNPCYGQHFRFDMGDMGITSFKAGDFAELQTWGTVSFANRDNNPDNDNTFTTIPDDAFPDGFANFVDFSGNDQLTVSPDWWAAVGSVRGLWIRNGEVTRSELQGGLLHGWTGLRFLDLSHNDIGSFERGWLTAAQRGALERLHINNTGFRASTFQVDGFDGMSNLDWIELDDNPYMKYLNTRWFRDNPLEHRGTLPTAPSSRSALWISGDTRLVGYFNKSADNEPDTANAEFDINSRPANTIDDDLRLYRPDGQADNRTVYDQVFPHYHVKGRLCPSAAPSSSDPQDCVGLARSLGEAENVPTQAIDVCAKSMLVRDAVIARLGSDANTRGALSASGMSYSVLANAHRPGETACHEDFGVVRQSELSELEWNPGGTGDTAPMDLSDQSIATLTTNDFHGLVNLEMLELGNFDNYPGNDNTLTNIANNVFKVVPSEYSRPATNLSLRGVPGVLPTADWWAYNHENRVKGLWLSDSGLNGRTVAPGFLDAFTGLAYLDLGDMMNLGAINVRWFKELERLGAGGDPDDSVRFQGSAIDYYYWSETSTVPDGPDRCSSLSLGGDKISCPAEWDGDAENLREAIYAAMDDSSDARIEHDSAGFPPLGIYNLCDRTRAVAIRIATDLTDSTFVSNADVRTAHMGKALPTAAACATADWGAIPVGHLVALDYSGSNAMALDRAAVRTLLGDASHDGLRSLRGADFAGLGNLEVLDLSENPLNRDGLPSGSFRDADLRSLDMGYTELRFPRRDWFGTRGLASFEELILDGTRVGGLNQPVGSFDSFQGLKKLSLRETRLGAVNVRWFRFLRSLEPASAGEATLDLTDALVSGWFQNSFFNRPDWLGTSGFGEDIALFELGTQAADAGADPTPMLERIAHAITSHAMRSGITLPAGFEVAMASGDEIRPARNICRRHQAVRDAVIAGWQHIAENDHFANLVEDWPEGVAHTAGAAACDDYFSAASLRSIRNIPWRLTPLDTQLMPMDLSSKGITELAADSFEGLHGALAIDLSDNDLRDLPDEVFSQVEDLILDGNANLGHIDRNWWEATALRHVNTIHADGIGLTPDDMVGDDAALTAFSGILSVKLSNNAVGTYQRAWLGSRNSLRELMLANTGVRSDEMEHNAFDGSVLLYHIDLGDNPNLEHINLRWFEGTRSLNGGAGAAGQALRFRGSFVRSYFYDADGNVVPTGSDLCPDLAGVTCPAVYDDNAEALATALTMTIEAQGGVQTTNIDHTWSEFAPRGLGTHNLCDRTRAVAARIATDLTDADIVSDAAVRTRHTGKTVPTNDACSMTDWGTVSGADLEALVYTVDEPMTLDLAAVRTLLGVDDHAGLPALGVDDFAGLRSLGVLSLHSNPLTQAGIPAGVFADATLLRLELASPELNYPDPAWFAAGRSEELTALVFGDAFIHNDLVPVGLFDRFSGLEHLSLVGAKLGTLNTRWFRALRNLDHESDANILMNFAFVEGWYYNEDANEYDRYHDSTTATADDFVLFDPDQNFGHTTVAVGQLQDALEQVIRDHAAGSTPALSDDFAIDIANQDDTPRAGNDSPVYASRDICRRTLQVRDALIAAMMTRVGAEAVPAGVTHTPGGSACDPYFEHLRTDHMRALEFRWRSATGWEQVPATPGGVLSPFDLRGTGITELRSDDFESLARMNAVDLSNNDLRDLPNDVFQSPNPSSVRLDGNVNLGTIDHLWWEPAHRGAGTLLSARNIGLTASDFPNGIAQLTWQRLDLSDNAIGTFDSAWVHNPLTYNRLALANTGLSGANLPHDAFDGMTRMHRIDLGDNPQLGQINLRWFRPFAGLQGGGSGAGTGNSMRLRNSVVGFYFHDDDGNVVPTGADLCPDLTLACPTEWDGVASTLAGAIKSAMNEMSPGNSVNIRHAWEEFPPIPQRSVDETQTAVATETHVPETLTAISDPMTQTAIAGLPDADMTAVVEGLPMNVQTAIANEFGSQTAQAEALTSAAETAVATETHVPETLTAISDPMTQTAIAGLPDADMTAVVEGLPMNVQTAIANEFGSQTAQAEALTSAAETAVATETHVPETLTAISDPMTQTAIAGLPDADMTAVVEGLPMNVQTAIANEFGSQTAQAEALTSAAETAVATETHVPETLTAFSEPLTQTAVAGLPAAEQTMIVEDLPTLAQTEIADLFVSATALADSATAIVTETHVPQTLTAVTHPLTRTAIAGLPAADMTAVVSGLPIEALSAIRDQYDAETAEALTMVAAEVSVPQTLTAFSEPLTQTAVAGLPAAEQTMIVEDLPGPAQTEIADLFVSATALADSATAIVTQTHVPQTLTAIAHPETQTAIAGLSDADMTAVVSGLPSIVQTAIAREYGSETAEAQTVVATETFVPQTLTAFSEPLTQTAVAGLPAAEQTMIVEDLPTLAQTEIADLFVSATALADSATAIVTETHVPQTLTAIAHPETQTAIAGLSDADMTAVVSGLPSIVQTAIGREYGSETAEAQTVVATETFVPQTLTAISHPVTLTAIGELPDADMTAIVSGLPANVQTAVANERGSATAAAASATALVTETYVPQTLTAFADPMTMTAVAGLPMAQQTAIVAGLPLSGQAAIANLYGTATASAQAASEQTATRAAELTGTAVTELDALVQTAFAETATASASAEALAATRTRAAQLTATENARLASVAETATRASEQTAEASATMAAVVERQAEQTATRASELTALAEVVSTRMAATETRIAQLQSDQRTAIAGMTETAAPQATSAAQTATAAVEQTAESDASATRVAGTATRTASLALTVAAQAEAMNAELTATAISQLETGLQTVVARQTAEAAPLATAAAEAAAAAAARAAVETAEAIASATQVAQTATRAAEATAAADLGVIILPTATFTPTPTASASPTAAAATPIGDVRPWLERIEAEVSSVAVNTGDVVRLSVEVYDRAGARDDRLADPGHDSGLRFRWTDNGAGGSFSAPDDARRVLYRVPSSPGRFTVDVVALPDGMCVADHDDVSTGAVRDADRADCRASIQVLVSRPASAPRPPPAPVNPSGVIPRSLVDADGVQYAVFTPREGGTFSGDGGVSVSAASGAVPDRQVLGVAVRRSSIGSAGDLPGASVDGGGVSIGARISLAGGFYEVLGIQRNGATPVSRLRLDDALSVCLPLPPQFAANLSDVTLVARAPEGALGVLSSSVVRQPDATADDDSGGLSVCGKVSLLPATVSVAKLGVVEPTSVPAVDPTGVETPDTGAASLGTTSAWRVLLLGGLLLGLVAVGLARWRTVMRHDGG